MDTTTPLGETIRHARRAAGLTQEQLAVAAGITAKTVRAVESGTTTPQRRVLKGLTEALGLDGSHDVHDGNPDRGSNRRGRNLGDGTAAAKRSPAPSHTGA